MTTDREHLDWLRQSINDSATLSATAKSDHLDPESPAAMVQQLTAARWDAQYIDGGGVRAINFAVRYRVNPSDSKTRLDAADALYALADALEVTDGSTYGITKTEGTSTPALIEYGEDGSEVWLAEFVSRRTVPSGTPVS